MDEPFALAVGEDPDGTTVVTLVGELDVSAKAQLDERLGRLATSSIPVVVVDVSRLTFIDSSGLGALVLGQRRMAERGGSIVIRGAKGPVLRAVQISGIGQVLDVE